MVRRGSIWPRQCAIATACAEFRAPSASRMCDMWLLTVCRAMPSRCATSSLVKPSAIRESTWISRSVNGRRALRGRDSREVRGDLTGTSRDRGDLTDTEGGVKSAGTNAPPTAGWRRNEPALPSNRRRMRPLTVTRATRVACAQTPASAPVKRWTRFGRRGSRRRGLERRGLELGLGSLLQDAVDVDVHLLVVEGGQPGDLLRLGQRRTVAPDHVLVHRRAGVDRPVAGGPLVRAVRLGLGGREQVHPDVGQRQVVARGQARL